MINMENLGNRIDLNFYTSSDVVCLAQILLGKVLCTKVNGKFTSGIISETEAYAGITDKASHAFGDRRTSRTEVMYASGGHAYVYLCYGIHSLFNIVTSIQNEPHAILVRSVIPLIGKRFMAERKRKEIISLKDAVGPGNVCKVMGISLIHNTLPLLPSENQDCIWLQDEGIEISKNDFSVSSRIGVAYAQEDANLPYRFLLNKNVSTALFDKYQNV